MASTEVSPHLTRSGRPGSSGRSRAVVLVLHGGKPSSLRSVDGRSASWRLMAAMQRSLAGAFARTGAETWLLRYRQRGWNGGTAPTADARWALERVRREVGDVPVVLLGHSMGARVAVHVADDPSVTGVVALAPWFEPTTPIRTLQGRRLVAAHARRDRITSFRMTAAYVERARRIGVDADLVDMGLLGHYMLSGTRRWRAVARDGVLNLLARETTERAGRRPE